MTARVFIRSGFILVAITLVVLQLPVARATCVANVTSVPLNATDGELFRFCGQGAQSGLATVTTFTDCSTLRSPENDSCVCRLGWFPGIHNECGQNVTVSRHCTPSELSAYCSLTSNCVRTCEASYIDVNAVRQFNCSHYLDERCFHGAVYPNIPATAAQVIATCGAYHATVAPLVGTCYAFTIGGGYSNCTFDASSCVCAPTAPAYFQRDGHPPCAFNYGVVPCNSTDIPNLCGDGAVNCTKRCLQPPVSLVSLQPRLGLMYNNSIVAALSHRCQVRFNSNGYHFAPNHGEQCVNDQTAHILQTCPCVPANVEGGTLNVGCGCYTGVAGTGDWFAANAYCAGTSYGRACSATCTPSAPLNPSCTTVAPPTTIAGRGTGYFDVLTCSCLPEQAMTQTGLDYINTMLCPVGQVIDLGTGQCLPYIGPCTEADVCTCLPGFNSSVNPQYCQHEYQADVCLTSDGEARDISSCGVFTDTAFWDCPLGEDGFTLTGNAACRPVCQCLPGTGRTPVPGDVNEQCDGADRACNIDDVHLFCPGGGYSSCTKRCQYGITTDPSTMGYCIFLPGSCVVATTPEYFPCTDAQFQSCGTATRSCTQGYLGGVAVGEPRCVCTEDGFQNTTAQCDSWTQYIFQTPNFCESACDPGWVYCAQRRFLLHVVPESFDRVVTILVVNWHLLRYDNERLKWYDNMTAVRNYAALRQLSHPFYLTVCGCDASILRGPVGHDQPAFTPSFSLPPQSPVQWVAGTSLPTNPQFDWSSTSGARSGILVDTFWLAGLEGRPVFDFYSGYPSYPGQYLPSIIDLFYHVTSCNGPSLQTTPSYPSTLVEAVDNFQKGFYYVRTEFIYRDPNYPGWWCSAFGVPNQFAVDLKNYPVDSLESDQTFHLSSLVTLIKNVFISRFPNDCTFDGCLEFAQWVSTGQPCGTPDFCQARADFDFDENSCQFCGSVPEFVTFYQMTLADDVFERRDIMAAISQSQRDLVNSMIVIYDIVNAFLEPDIRAATGNGGNFRVGAWYAGFHTGLDQASLGLGQEFQEQTLALSFYPGVPGLNILQHNDTNIGKAAPVAVNLATFSPYYKVGVFNRLYRGCACLWRDATHPDCSCNGCCDFATGSRTVVGPRCSTSTDNCALVPKFALQVYGASILQNACPQPIYTRLANNKTYTGCNYDFVTNYILNCDYNTGSNCMDACTADLVHQVADLYCYNGTFMVSLFGDDQNNVQGSCGCDVGWYADPATGRCTYEVCGTASSAHSFFNDQTLQTRSARLQINGECNGHGHHNPDGDCVCDPGWLPPCCSEFCSTAVNSAWMCDTSEQHLQYCDYNDTSNPHWVCSETPEGFWDQPCCQNFIWYSTNTPHCSYHTTMTAPNGTVFPITPRDNGFLSFGEIVTTHTASPVAVRTFSRPFCACVEPWTGPWCNISTCPSTESGGICNGKGTCIAGSCQQKNQLTGLLDCLINGISTGFAGCSCEEDIVDECFDVVSGQMCGGPTRGLCLLRPVVPLVYGCTCVNGFTGQFCATPPCDSTFCNSPVGGTCLYTETPQRCQCFDSKSGSGQNIYEGATCNITVTAACGAHPSANQLLKCGGHGQCVYSAGIGNFHCVCQDGYTDGPLGPCTLSPCIPPCNHGVCDTSQSPPQCRCFKHWGIDDQGNKCSKTDCAPLGLPSPLESTVSTCQCFDNSTTFESGCTLKGCPVSSSDGFTCGKLHPLFPPTCSQTVVCPSSGCNCCNNGTCSCHWSSQLNTSTHVCDPICDLTHTVDILSTDQCVNQVCGPVFSACVCQPGYDPAVHCSDTFCENGGRLGPGGSACICPPQFSGQKCEIDACHDFGTWNFTTGRCNCYFPFAGDDCHTNRCLNGGIAIPDGPNAPNYKCSCPPVYTGTFCQVDLCAVAGHGVANASATGCTCTGTLSGPFCSLCLPPSQNISNVCTCGTQFVGEQCQIRRCGPQGTYNSTTSLCTCGGVSKKNPLTGLCTLDNCGPFGVASANLGSCACSAGSVLVSMLDASHSYWCMPICFNGGTYNNALPGCNCPVGTFQPFCNHTVLASSSSSSSSSSTGVHHTSSSTGQTTPTPTPSSSSSSGPQEIPSSTAETNHTNSSSSTGAHVSAPAQQGVERSSFDMPVIALVSAMGVGLVAGGILVGVLGSSKTSAAADAAVAEPLLAATANPTTATAMPAVVATAGFGVSRSAKRKKQRGGRVS